jgi:hypothetical protein
MPTVESKIGVYVMRRQVDDPFCTRATKATPFEYQGYPKRPRVDILSLGEKKKIVSEGRVVESLKIY